MSEQTSNPNRRPAANTGASKGLPETGLPAAETAAQALWRIARKSKVPSEAYAVELGGEGAKASGGAWRSRIAVLRGFGLIDTDGDLIGLSSRGLQLVDVSSPAGQVQARRQAVLGHKTYKDLIVGVEGTELPNVATLATQFQFRFGKAPEVAQRAARAYVDSLRHADLLDDSNVVRNASARVGAADPGSADGETPADGDPLEIPFDPIEDPEPSVNGDRQRGGQSTGLNVVDPFSGGGRSPGPGAASIAISVSLDLSDFPADDVVRILQALKG